jgi:hypothetical protein
MSQLENQLSRYGAIARVIPDLVPGAKVFLVSDSDDTTVGPLNIGSEFPVDRDGVTRVYTTVQAAVNAASAGRGDVILVLPSYDQSVTGADSWNTAGVSIIGVGRGAQRPTIRYTGASGEVGIGASNIRVSGFRFLAAADSIARAVDIDSGFTGIHFDNNIFDFDTTTSDFRVMLRVGSKRSVIENNRFIAADSAPASGRAISFRGGAASYSIIRRNYFYGQYDTLGDTTNGAGVIVQDTTDTADTNNSGMVIEDNVIVNTDTAVAILMRLDGGGFRSMGIVTNNRLVSFDSSSADTAKVITGTGVGVGFKFVDNIISSDSSTEHRVGDTSPVA